MRGCASRRARSIKWRRSIVCRRAVRASSADGYGITETPTMARDELMVVRGRWDPADCRCRGWPFASSIRSR
jgi:hypothetical protein